MLSTQRRRRRNIAYHHRPPLPLPSHHRQPLAVARYSTVGQPHTIRQYAFGDSIGTDRRLIAFADSTPALHRSVSFHYSTLQLTTHRNHRYHLSPYLSTLSLLTLITLLPINITHFTPQSSCSPPLRSSPIVRHRSSITLIHYNSDDRDCATTTGIDCLSIIALIDYHTHRAFVLRLRTRLITPDRYWRLFTFSGPGLRWGFCWTFWALGPSSWGFQGRRRRMM